jgi:hypothetical protein
MMARHLDGVHLMCVTACRACGIFKHFSGFGFFLLSNIVPAHFAVMFRERSLDTEPMLLEFSGEIFHWRCPAPYLFVAVPAEPSQTLKAISAGLTL